MLNMGIAKTQNFGKIERKLDIESKSDNKAESIKKNKIKRWRRFCATVAIMQGLPYISHTPCVVTRAHDKGCWRSLYFLSYI